MGSDQVAAIRPAIAEAYEAAASGDSNYFAKFELSADADVWVEVAVDTVNFRYPSSTEPLRLLAERGIQPLAGLSLQSWQPTVYAAVNHTETDLRAIAKFVDALFASVLGSGAEYPVDVSLERFAS